MDLARRVTRYPHSDWAGSTGAGRSAAMLDGLLEGATSSRKRSWWPKCLSMSKCYHSPMLPLRQTPEIYASVHQVSAGSQNSVSLPSQAVAVILAALIAGTIGLLTSRYTIRKTLEHQRVQLFNERFSTASDKLGHEQASTRLAGIYALAGLADDWEAQRQTCVHVLCSYLRLPYEPNPASPDYRRGEREVRRTTIRIIRDHLRPGFSSVSWAKCNFSFEGAIFDCGDLTGAQFSGGNVSFYGARFAAGTFHFNRVHFDGAHVSFTRAQFTGSDVRFDGAKFLSGDVSFEDAKHTAGRVSFKDVEFAAECKVSGDPLNHLTKPARQDSSRRPTAWPWHRSAYSP